MYAQAAIFRSNDILIQQCDSLETWHHVLAGISSSKQELLFVLTDIATMVTVIVLCFCGNT